MANRKGTSSGWSKANDPMPLTAKALGGRRDDLQDWAQFTMAESHVLTESPELLFQQAFNSSGDTAPARAAGRRFQAGSERRPWLRRINKRSERSVCLLTLAGHDGRIDFCAFASDGSAIAVASSGALKLWDAASGQELTNVSIGLDPKCAAITPVGTRVVTAYSQRWWKETKVFELADASELFAIYAREEPPPSPASPLWPPDIRLSPYPPEGETYWDTSCCAFSPNGALLAVVGTWYRQWIEYTRLFDTSSWREIATFEGPKIEVPYETNRVVFSNGGDVLALTSKNGIRILRVADGSELATLPRGAPATFTCDGRLLASFRDQQSQSDELTIRSWETGTWTELEAVTCRAGKGFVAAISVDGRRLAIADGNAVKVCDVVRGAEAVTLGQHGQYVTCCAFSADGQRLVSGAWGEVKVWDAGTVTSDAAPHTGTVHRCAFSPDGTRLVTASEDASAKLWTPAGQETAVLKHGRPVKWVAFSPDGTRLLTRSDMKLLMLWEARTGKELARLGPHCYQVLACALSPDGSRIVSGSGIAGNGELWLWDGETGRFLSSFEGHTSWINYCVFTADGKRVLSVSDDGTLRLWGVDTGEQIAILLDAKAHLVPWDLSSNGTRIAAGMNDGSVHLWDAATGEKLGRHSGHAGSVSVCRFSPSGKLIATGDWHYESTVKLWDATSGAALGTLAEERDPEMRKIDACVFSPDGRRLFSISSGSSDHVRVWDLSDGREITRIVGKVEIRGFSPDGSLMLTGRRWLRVWDTDSVTEIARHPSTGAMSMAWSPDAELLAVGELSGHVHILHLENRLWALPRSATSVRPMAPRSTSGRATRQPKRIGRNDPCPCGSGKKYSKCHGVR